MKLELRHCIPACLYLLVMMFPSLAHAQRFADVTPDYWAFSFIETLADAGVTAGCGNGNYCPEALVSRAQMAVFIERGMNGSAYRPPAATGNVFNDVGAGDFAANFIEQLASDGITAGCGGGNYCPNNNVTRAQMAVFLLRAKYGAGYAPPPATGAFADVPQGSFADAWIEQLAEEGITAGCGGGNYCPEADVTRDQMAVFLVRTFGLLPAISVIVVAGREEAYATWNSVAGASSYDLYYGTFPDLTKSNSTQVPGVTSPHTITGLADGVTYYFMVTPVNATGEGVEGTIASATTLPPLQWTQEQLLRFAPEVFMHDFDRYLPSAVDPYYLGAIEIVDSVTGIPDPDPVTGADLSSHLNDPPASFFLRTTANRLSPNNHLSPVYQGQPAVPGMQEVIEAPMYVHVLPGPETDGVPEYFDLQYIFFYPYSGPQVFRIGLSDSSNLCTTTSGWTGYWPPLATHEGDFEHVTVRVNATFSDIIAVYMDAHGSTLGRWWQADDPDLQFFDGTHVRAYSALNTHATYPYARNSIVIESAPAEAIVAANLVAVTEGYVICDAIRWMDFADTTRAGPRWRPWEFVAGLKELRFDSISGPANEQDWVGFPGRYGPRWIPDVFQLGFPRLICDDLVACGNLKNFAGEALMGGFEAGDFIIGLDDKKDRNGPSLLSAGWFLNGDPTFLKVEKTTEAVTPSWAAIAFNWMADLDGDEQEEIVSGSGLTWFVKWWDPVAGEFNHVAHSVTGSDPQAANAAPFTWVGDYDGDRRNEILVASGEFLYVKRFEGDGETGNFVALPRFTLTAPVYNSEFYNWMGDINGDGRDEIISVSNATAWVKWYRPPPDNDWVQEEYPVPAFWGANGFNFVADLDGELDPSTGLPTDEIISVVGNTIYVKRFNGTGFVQDPPYTYRGSLGDNDFLAWVGEVTGDGLLDLIATDGANIYIKQYNGIGFTSASVPVADWGGAWFNWTADLDEDGVDEIISGNNNSVFVKKIIPMPSGIESFPVDDWE